MSARNTTYYKLPEGLSEGAQTLIKQLVLFDSKYPGGLQDGMLDWLEVVANGAKKYGLNTYLEPNGKSASRKHMHDSITHHRAESLVLGPYARDKDSGLHPNLHETCRSIMQYIRDKRGIVHEDDKPVLCCPKFDAVKGEVFTYFTKEYPSNPEMFDPECD